MFLSKLFKHTRAKALTALAGLTMVIGVGAIAFASPSSVIEAWASADPVDLYVRGTQCSTPWAAEDTYQLTKNPFNDNDLGVIRDVSLSAGHGFKIGSSDWGTSYSSDNLTTNSNFHKGARRGTWSGSANGNLSFSAASPERYDAADSATVTFSNTTDSWWWDSCTWGLFLANNSNEYKYGTTTKGTNQCSWSNVNLETYDKKIRFYRAGSTTGEWYNSTNDYDNMNSESNDPNLYKMRDKNIAVKTTGVYDIYVHSDGSIEIKDAAASNKYTITYKYVVDGVVQDKVSDGTISNITRNTPYVNLTEPSFYGCSFDGWFLEEACRTGLSGYTVVDSRTVYAKFTSDQSSTAVYFDVSSTFQSSLSKSEKDGSGNDVYYTWIAYWNNTISKSSMVKVRELTAISFDGHKFYRAEIPENAEGFLICIGDTNYTNHWEQSIDFSIGTGADPTYNNGHNLCQIKDGGAGQKRSADWLDIAYYLQMASNTAFSSNLTTKNMSSPKNASTGNAAEVLNVAVPNGYYVRGQYFIDASHYGFNKVEGGEDGDSNSNNWVYTEQVSNVGIHFKAAKTCNFYINGSGQIWVVDTSGVDAGGYIYISTQLTPANIKVDCSVSGRSYYSHARLSTVDGVTSSSTLTFNSVQGMIIVPIYNHRNGDPYSSGTAYSITLSSADGAKTTNVTGVTVVTGSPLYHITLSTSAAWGASTAVATTKGAAAKTAYQIDAAIAGAPNSSVCNIDPDTAKTLCSLYDVAETKALLESDSSAYSIETWDGDNTTRRGSPSYTGSAHAQFSYVRYELGLRAGEGYKTSYPYSGVFYPGAHTSDQSPLTTTLWIVLGCGLLGLGAIGTAYFIGKKKKHQA